MEIEEDYVSLEVAKLLKEKLFVGSEEIGCRCGFYSEYPDSFEVGKGITTASGQEVGLVYDGLDNSTLRTREYLRPTVQMARKWLNKVKGICNYISCENFEERYYWVAYKRPSFIRTRSKKTFATEEAAAEDLIKYCLTKLID